MRASAVRQAIIEALQGALVDNRARGSDTLSVHRHPTPPESVPSRTCMVSLSAPPNKSELDTCDLFEVTYSVAIYYPAGNDTEDRIASDAERIYKPLWRLHEAHADMVDSEPGIPTSDESMGMLTMRLDLRIQYRLDSTLV